MLVTEKFIRKDGIGIIMRYSILFLAVLIVGCAPSPAWDFESCVLAGYPVMESYPRQCSDGAGNLYVEQIDDLDDLYACSSSADCIPLPSECHPMECINSGHAMLFESPEACTLEFRYEAAYSPDDCGCVDGICTNLNLGRDAIP